MKNKKIFIILGVILAVTIATIIIVCNRAKIEEVLKIGKVDDWVYESQNQYNSKSSYINYNAAFESVATSDMASSNKTNSYIGYSTGGAKDVNNFRENIKSNYFPILTDITYQGIFYDYSFDTGTTNESTQLFSPSYSYAISKDPISNELEYYMTVGLNSNIKQSDFQRKKLNLVIMLDISGSMDSSLDKYYYDGDLEQSKEETSKMQAAEQSINCLIDQLNDDDRFGVVLFDNDAYLGKEMNLVKSTDLDAIKNHILEIKAQGGTNFSAGYDKSTQLFDEYLDVDSEEYENRIIVITDAMPNLGKTSKDGLYNDIKQNSEKGINTTFIGVGVDFNTELIENISKVNGANYYSVHNVEEFKLRMGEQFEYMVTPLVYDLKLDFDSEYFDIEQIYGSDDVNKDTGNIMNVNTLFPSASNSNGEVKGGVILLKLKPKQNANDLMRTTKLSVSYKDRNGKNYSNEQKVNIKSDLKEEYYGNTGIRKAIVLVRYVNTIKNWIMYERTGEERFYIVEYAGIPECDSINEEAKYLLGENERTSVKLTVSQNYKNVFSKIKTYIESENEQIQDSLLEQEINILDKLINY